MQKRERFGRWGRVLLPMTIAAVFILALVPPTLGIEYWFVTPIVVALVLFALAADLGRADHEFVFAVRNSWTNRSEVAWREAHRLARWLYAGLGALILLMIRDRWTLVAIGGLVINVVVLSLASSFFAGRKPDDS